MFVRTFRHLPRLTPPRWGATTFVCALTWFAFLATASAQSGGPADYRVYPLKFKAAADAERIVSQMLSGQPAAQVGVDAAKNQLLVRGPQEVQDVVRQLLESFDRPPAAAPAVKPVVNTYPCEPNRLAEAVNALRAQFAGRPDVRIASDPGTSRLLVLAPPDVHTALAKQLGGDPPVPPASQPSVQGATGQAPAKQVVVHSPAAAAADSPARMGGAASYEPVQQLVPVGNIRAEQIEMRLHDLLGPRLIPMTSPQGGVFGQRLSDDAGHVVELRVDPTRNAVHLVGWRPLVLQMAELIHVLDTPQQSPDRSVSIVHLRGNARTRLRQAMGGNQSPPPQSAPSAPAGGVVPIPTAPDANKSGYARPSAPGVSLTAHLYQAAPAAGGAPAGPPSTGSPAPGPSAEQPESAVMPVSPEVEQQLQQQLQRLRQLGEDVEVQTLPDLDVLILRGRQHDVEEMRRIIEEIERISAEEAPGIEVYQLRYASSTSLAQVLKETGADLTNTRQGRATITPLVKPNALLLIGWGQALEAIKELISKLDQPVAPGTQVQVFRLKHTPASAAEATIRQFLTGRKGLATEAQLVADARTNSLIVCAAPRDLAEVVLLIERLDVGQSAAVNQVRIFPLENSLAADVAATLQMAIQGSIAGSGLSPQKSAVLELLTIDTQGAKKLKSGLLNDVTITPDVRMNTLIVSAPAESIDLLAELIRQLDSPTAVAQIKVFHIVNGDANSLVLMLRALLPPQLGGGTQLQLPAAEGETALTPLRFSVDIRTNTIIAVGSAGDLAIIEALLLRLDQRALEQRRSTIVRLRNSPAGDVATAINEYLRSERTVMQAAPGTLNPFLQIEKEVIVVPEPVSNSLIVSATPRYYEDIMKLVDELDAQPPMVLIQVLIGSVDLRNMSEFGVELGLQDALLFDRSVVTDGTLDPGFDFNNSSLGNAASAGSLATRRNVAGQALSNFDLSRIGSAGYSGLVLAASSESVSVLIRALQECRHLEVLARPQIMTLDNQPSFIQVGQRVPRISGSAINTVGQVNSIVLENVGLILGVTPRVSPEGLVVMEIDAERSELGSIDEGIPVAFSGDQVIRSPVTNLTMAQTTVSAADGETIVLGGLINKTNNVIRRRVPWLSEVPVLGNLFRYDSNSTQRTELLIILTPHIVRTPKDAERYKQLEAARMHWCLADVNNLNGPTGIGGTQVIYPDTDPRGVKSTTVSPGQAEPEPMEPMPVPERVPTPNPVLPRVDFPESTAPSASQDTSAPAPSASTGANAKSPSAAARQEGS